MNLKLPEADCVAIQRGRHYWPAGYLRPMTLEQMLEVKLPKGTAAQYVALEDGTGNLYDRKLGRFVLVREPLTERPQKVKPPKRPGVVSRHGALLRQAMTSPATEGLVHARSAD